MKKLIAVCLILCALTLCFTACMRDKDRAENNGVVTDDTTRRTETTDKTTTSKTTTGKNTTDKSTTDKNDGGILDDAGNAVSDAVEGVTDAVDDMLGGTSDTKN